MRLGSTDLLPFHQRFKGPYSQFVDNCLLASKTIMDFKGPQVITARLKELGLYSVGSESPTVYIRSYLMRGGKRPVLE